MYKKLYELTIISTSVQFFLHEIFKWKDIIFNARKKKLISSFQIIFNWRICHKNKILNKRDNTILFDESLIIVLCRFLS